MTLREVADALGIETYPEGMEQYYPIPEERKEELCSLELIQRLQDRFDLFGKYLDQVKEGFLDLLERDHVRLEWLNASSLYLKDCTLKEARKLVHPDGGETPASRWMPLLVHLPSIENTYDELVRRGFPPEHAIVTLEGYKINIEVVEQHMTGWAGINNAYSAWLYLYTKAQIFYHAGLNFEVRTAPSYFPYIIQNKTTGELVPLMIKEPIHRSGIQLGSVLAKDEEGSFIPTFEETEDAYIGHPARDYRVQKEKEVFPKSEWELVLQNGDAIVSLHIPRQTDFSPEAISKSLEEGFALAQKCYPEFHFKAFYCCSWLLSPVLNQVLGEKAKISSFSSRFHRYPQKSGGKSVFGYVFPKKASKCYDTLPENTTLQRELKKWFQDGKYVYDTAGVILIK